MIVKKNDLILPNQTRLANSIVPEKQVFTFLDLYNVIFTGKVVINNGNIPAIIQH